MSTVTRQSIVGVKFAAMNGNKSMPAIETISNGDLKLNRKKNSDKQADLSSYFN